MSAGVGDVGEPGGGGAAALVDVGDQLVEIFLTAGGGDDLGAAGGEGLGADGADAGGGAGDDDDLVLQVVHGDLPVRWFSTHSLVRPVRQSFRRGEVSACGA
jgi:hypothetical protein